MIYRAYENATWDFNTFFTSPATTERDVLKTDFYSILRKCGYLHRNNAICGSISRVMVEYVGATGNTVDVPSSKDQQDFFQKWAKNCTVRGDNWTRARRIRITDIVESGGLLVLFTQDPDRKPDEVGLKLDFVQGGRVCTPSDIVEGESVNGVTVWQGIAYNSYGAEIGYYYKEGDSYVYVSKYNDLGMLNAYFERSPDAEKPTSGRTLPMINVVMTQIELLSKIEKNMGNWAEKVSALGLFIEATDPQSVYSGMGLTNDDGSYQTTSFLDNTSLEGDVKPNFIGVTPAGTKANIVSPSGSADYNPIIKYFQKTISSGIGIISTLLHGDTEGKNFATSKFEAQTFMRKNENWATSINHLDELIIRQVWQEANLRGIANFNVEELIVFGGSADFEGVDASKSADASSKRIANMSTTKSYEASKLGHDFDSNLETTISEMNKIREMAEKNNWKTEQVMKWILSGEIDVGVGVSAVNEPQEEGNENGN